MKRIFAFAVLMMWMGAALAAHDRASEALLKRVSPDSAGKIVFEVKSDKPDTNYFQNEMKGGKPLITATTPSVLPQS